MKRTLLNVIIEKKKNIIEMSAEEKKINTKTADQHCLR